jgi:hypothetical protein
MKQNILLKAFTVLIVVFINVNNAYSQGNEPRGRILNDNETLEAYQKALENPDVRAYMETLLGLGYRHLFEYSIAVGIEGEEGFFINLGFDKGDPSLTTHIIYREKGDKVVVTFWEGVINEDGSVETTSEFRVKEGTRAEPSYEMTELTKVMGCFLPTCGAAIVGCKYTGPFFVKCAVGSCLTAAGICAILYLLCWL